MEGQTPPSSLSKKWDKRFLDLAALVASWSKDPSTKVGAVIADGKHVVSLGFNGFPPSIPDKEEWLNEREIKYRLVIHAEINAILNAKTKVDGCTLYVHPLCPCGECAKFIVASGIKRVVSTHSDNPRWDASQCSDIFGKAGVTFEVH